MLPRGLDCQRDCWSGAESYRQNH